MTAPTDAAPAPEGFAESLPESLIYPAATLDEELAPISLFQEINERRARVENAELLAHLRGL